jgi:tRNA-2-methylthio-N6-dimethylallyladenosine synthase
VVVKERYSQLAVLVDEIAWEENKRLVGRTVELMVAEGEGRKDGETLRLSGRAPDNRLVHFVPASSARDSATTREGASASDGVTDAGMPRPGDLVTVEITYAAPHHLVSDLPATGLRRTRSGDAWQARRSADSCAPAPGATSGAAAPVLLGLPTLRP